MFSSFFLPSSNLKYAKVDVEHCQISFWDPQDLPTQDYDSGLSNEQIFIMLAAPQTATHSSPTVIALSHQVLCPQCALFPPILNANIIQTSWQ